MRVALPLGLTHKGAARTSISTGQLEDFPPKADSTMPESVGFISHIADNKSTRRLIASILIPLLIVYTTGCSLFASSTQKLTISSDPDGAEVVVNGELVGSTPLQTRIRRRGDASIIIRKEGFKTVTRSTDRSLSTVGILDIIGGCIWLVPFLGLIADGAWKQEPTNMSVMLPKADKK